MCSPPTAAPTSARPRRASNISSSARSPAASCSTAFRCSTASPARCQFTGIAAAFARDGTPSLGLLFGLVFLLAGLAFKISAVPFHMWTPDVYEGAPTPVTAFFASAPKVAAVLLATRVCLDALGPAIDAWRQIVIFAALASIFLGAVAAYGQTNIKRLLAYSSINNVGFALIGLAAGGPAGASSVLFYMAVYVVMTLGAFLCVLRMRDADGEPVESHRQPVRPVADPARPSPRRIAIFMFSLAGIPPLFGFWPKLLVFTRGGRRRAGRARGRRHPRHGGRRLLLPARSSRSCTSTTPGRAVRPGAAQPVEAVLILLAALIVSPLGYLLIGPLGELDRPRRGIACSEPHPHRRADRLDQRRPACRSAARSKATGWSRWSGRRARAARAASGSRSTAISPAALWSSCAPAIRRAPSLSLAAGLALIEAVDAAAPGCALMLKWPNDLLLDGGKLAGILLERSGDRIVVGFGVNLAARAGSSTDRATAVARRRDHARRPSRPLLAAQLRAAARAVAQRATRALFAEAWLARAHPLGTPLTVHVDAGRASSAAASTGSSPTARCGCALDDGADRDRPRRRRRACEARRRRAARAPPMLLAIDAGNTNLVFALVEGGDDQDALADRHRPAPHRRPICRLAPPIARARRLCQGRCRRGDHRHRRPARAPQSRSARRANISTSSR